MFQFVCDNIRYQLVWIVIFSRLTSDNIQPLLIWNVIFYRLIICNPISIKCLKQCCLGCCIVLICNLNAIYHFSGYQYECFSLFLCFFSYTLFFFFFFMVRTTYILFVQCKSNTLWICSAHQLNNLYFNWNQHGFLRSIINGRLCIINNHQN